MERDHVDHILEEWARKRPDLDLSAMAVIARVTRASRILERDIEGVLVRFGINRAMFAVLAALFRAGPPHRLTPTQLFDALLVSWGAMTNRLDRLSDAGLVTRTPDSNDRRSHVVALSPEGLRVINDAVTAHTENELRILRSFSYQERDQLAGLLRKLLLSIADGREPGELNLEAAGAAS